MIPIWIYAGRKLKSDLRSKQVPLLALSAAFSFVIMMFNMPMPGGSTGHAVGGAIIGIILGPWAAVISISVALVLQALMFGDGGVTAIGANCLNMAVIMPFSAYYIYKFISGNAPITSRKRMIASAIAGYVSLTLAAAATGFMFGIQPILHQSPDGTPLYMPYSLNIALPAMLLEHLLFFGFIEALVTALIFSYMQKSDPSLLELGANDGKKDLRKAAKTTSS
jgi:cobalt/nickel transport system permease protein